MTSKRRCDCPPNHSNCLTAKEWVKAQIGVWEFAYTKEDIRDKEKHPAVFPVALAERVISLFTHKGECVVDPFVGAGTTLVAAKKLGREALGADLNPDYVTLAQERLDQTPPDDPVLWQVPIEENAMVFHQYLATGSVRLVFTSPPYANLLDRTRTNKSRRTDTRENEQFGKNEQYSADERDLGTMPPDAYADAMRAVFSSLLPCLTPDANVVINVGNYYKDKHRVDMHGVMLAAIESAGYEYRNTIIWDRRNLVNGVGIFGWPNNYITMGTTFEYLLHFKKREAA